MAIKKQYSPEALGILTSESLEGVGAGTLLRSLEPIFAAQTDYLLQKLEQAKPELNELLDLRAKISVIRGLQRELKARVALGSEASDLLRN